MPIIHSESPQYLPILYSDIKLRTMGFPRQEYWSGLPFPPPGDLPDPGIEPTSSVSPALAGGFLTTSALVAPYPRIFGQEAARCIVPKPLTHDQKPKGGDQDVMRP